VHADPFSAHAICRATDRSQGNLIAFLFALSLELTNKLKNPEIQVSTTIPCIARSAPYAVIEPVRTTLAKNPDGLPQNVPSRKRSFTILLRIAAQEEQSAFGANDAMQYVPSVFGHGSTLGQDNISRGG